MPVIDFNAMEKEGKRLQRFLAGKRVGAMGMFNIKDVAREAGVSISTVSRVINESKAVSDELRKKVEDAIDTLGYRTSSVAQSLKNSKTNKIAVIVTSVSRTFFTSVIDGINEAAAEYGYAVLIAETHDDLDTEMELVDSFVSQWVDGIILASSAYDGSEKTAKYIQRLGQLQKKGRRIPVVTLEFSLGNPNIDSVVVDYEAASYEAVSYLLKLGYRRIAHVSLPNNHTIGQKRFEGYKRAHEEMGIDYDDDHIISGNYTTYSGYQIVKGLITGRHTFDSIYCANDQMAVGALKACDELNVRVPEEMAIVGNDDIFAASIVTPSLTSVHVPKREMGEVAMQRLHELLEDETLEPGKVITLPTTFMERESTVRGAKGSLRYLEW